MNVRIARLLGPATRLQASRHCGNIAYFRFNESMRQDPLHGGGVGPVAAQLESALHAGIRSLDHRGPDSSGCWVSESRQVGLGHVRLSLVDLSDAGSQPMHNESKEVSLIANGEV